MLLDSFWGFSCFKVLYVGEGIISKQLCSFFFFFFLFFDISEYLMIAFIERIYPVQTNLFKAWSDAGLQRCFLFLV